MSSYILKFGPKKGDSNSNSFTVDSASEADPADLINVPNPAIKDNKDAKLLLLSVNYDKSLYSPCSVSAEISVNGLATAAVDELVSLFKERTVTFAGQAPTSDGVIFSEIEIGTDYFVQSVKPIVTYKSTGDISSCSVSLKIYSRDYLLKEKKYSQAYLSKKFSTDIIKATLDGCLKGCSVGFTAETSRLLHTVYKGNELIQPYHVQYNEDFYSFIARIAARHGEFLFFEGGKLCLGLPGVSSEAVDLNKLKPVSPQASSGEKTFNLVQSFELEESRVPEQAPSFHQNYLHTDSAVNYVQVQNKVGSDYKPGDGPYFNEDCFDEYFDVYGKDDNSKPDNMTYEQPWGSWVKIGLTQLLPTLASFSTGYAFSTSKGISDIITNVGLEIGKAALRVKSANDTYISQVDNVPAPYSTEQKGTNAQCMFGSYTDATQKGNFMTAFYSAIRAGELASSAKMYKITVKSCMTALNVGDTVKLGSAEYIICRVYGDYSDGTDKQYIEVILRNKDNAKIFPPYNSCSEHPMAVPQTAVVEEFKDPRRLSRVRIRYPWQIKEDVTVDNATKTMYVPSPWVRLAQPLAGPNAACNMVPRTGSEVMVGYIDGNIDRPYIIGCLLNSAVQPEKYTSQYGDREIRSETGSKIVLGAGNFLNYAADFLPFVGFASSLASPFLMPLFTKMMTDAPLTAFGAGKVTLTDGFGLFTIEGDTTKRAITIDSTIGKVTISALTGIDISSTLSDVTISGQNIHLKAGNNITIESGLNIKAELDDLERKKAAEKMTDKHGTAGSILVGAGDIAAQTFSNLIVGAIDFSFFRAIYDAINTPKEGTLKLKSHRYLQLEAGEGSAIDTQEGFVSEYFARKALDKLDAIAMFTATACNYSLKERLLALSRAKMALVKKYTYDTHFIKGIDPLTIDIMTFGASNNTLNAKSLIKQGVEIPETFNFKEFETMVNNLHNAADKFYTFVDRIQRTDKYGYKIVDWVTAPKRYVGRKLVSSSTFAAYKNLPESLHEDVRGSYAENLQAVFGDEYNYSLSNGINCFASMSDDDIISKVRLFQDHYFRYLVYKYASKDGKAIYLTSGAPAISKRDKITRDKWVAIVKHIKLREKAYDVGWQKIKKDALARFKAYKGEISSESSNWGTFQKGKILISEAKDQTISLNSNHNQWEAQKHDSQEYITKYLMEK